MLGGTLSAYRLPGFVLPGYIIIEKGPQKPLKKFYLGPLLKDKHSV